MVYKGLLFKLALIIDSLNEFFESLCFSIKKEKLLQLQAIVTSLLHVIELSFK